MQECVNMYKIIRAYTIENIFLVRVFRERICNLKYCKTKFFYGYIN